MPLRDHFHPPVSDLTSWDGLYGQWPAMIVLDLFERLPPWYVASPHVHLGAFEIDVATSERDAASRFAAEAGAADGGNGGVAAAVWAPPEPTLSVTAEMPGQDEYEVRIFETEGRRLVAAIEIVSPANKDRPESRRVFAAKCAALLGQGVSVSIIDLVTTHRSNLYGELLGLLDLADPSLGPIPPPCTPWHAAGGKRARRGAWKLGSIPWPWASACRPCRCGSALTGRRPWTWSRVTSRRATCSAFPDIPQCVA